ncbi:MAG: hypothetical protein FAF03_12160 [Epsilonproteobacteria bacterium]|nr:hypothetical protein [Campylobacterota bacterium]
MGKIVIIFAILTATIFAETEGSDSLEKNCLACHKKQQIPSALIYRRYLMKYSTSAQIEEAIFRYLKDPKKENSIMPPQFFLKFPMREKMELDDATLKHNIKSYLKKFDVKQYLIVDK